MIAGIELTPGDGVVPGSVVDVIREGRDYYDNLGVDIEMPVLDTVTGIVTGYLYIVGVDLDEEGNSIIEVEYTEY